MNFTLRPSQTEILRYRYRRGMNPTAMSTKPFGL
jgi:hypothetical protein